MVSAFKSYRKSICSIKNKRPTIAAFVIVNVSSVICEQTLVLWNRDLTHFRNCYSCLYLGWQFRAASSGKSDILVLKSPKLSQRTACEQRVGLFDAAMCLDSITQWCPQCIHNYSFTINTNRLSKNMLFLCN